MKQQYRHAVGMMCILAFSNIGCIICTRRFADAGSKSHAGASLIPTRLVFWSLNVYILDGDFVACHSVCVCVCASDTLLLTNKLMGVIVQWAVVTCPAFTRVILHDASAFLCVLCRQCSNVTRCGKVIFVRQLSTLVVSHKLFLLNPVKESNTSVHAQRSVTEMHLDLFSLPTEWLLRK